MRTNQAMVLLSCAAVILSLSIGTSKYTYMVSCIKRIVLHYALCCFLVYTEPTLWCAFHPSAVALPANLKVLKVGLMGPTDPSEPWYNSVRAACIQVAMAKLQAKSMHAPMIP